MQASDLASAEDGSWALCNKTLLIKFRGRDRYGGVYESQAPVLTVCLLGQTRFDAQWPLVLNFADEWFGFDVAPRDAIRLGTYTAGIHGSDWLVKDD